MQPSTRAVGCCKSNCSCRFLDCHGLFGAIGCFILALNGSASQGIRRATHLVVGRSPDGPTSPVARSTQLPDVGPIIPLEKPGQFARIEIGWYSQPRPPSFASQPSHPRQEHHAHFSNNQPQSNGPYQTHIPLSGAPNVEKRNPVDQLLSNPLHPRFQLSPLSFPSPPTLSGPPKRGKRDSVDQHKRCKHQKRLTS